MAKGKYAEWLEKEKLLLLECWARDGLTDEQTAHNMGISRRTLNDWKNKYSPISLALKKGKEIVDYEVENAMLKRAKGYEYEEVQQLMEDKDGIITKKTVKTKKHIPADVVAAIFWLKNRKPDKWKDKQNINVTATQVTIVDDVE